MPVRIETERLPKIQFITHADTRYTLVESALVALSCGIRWIQFRGKDLREEEAETMARSVQELCRRHKALFVIDDNVLLAKKLQADGVHLGKEDMPIAQARDILGDDYLIGGTANTWEDVEKIRDEGGNYIGLGPFRFTRTKKKLSPILGIEGYARIMEKARDTGMDLPVFAIGGIRPEDGPALKRCGVFGLAVSSALLQADDPQEEVNKFTSNFIRTCKN